MTAYGRSNNVEFRPVRSPTDTSVQSETYPNLTQSNSRIMESMLSYLNQDIDQIGSDLTRINLVN